MVFFPCAVQVAFAPLPLPSTALAGLAHAEKHVSQYQAPTGPLAMTARLLTPFLVLALSILFGLYQIRLKPYFEDSRRKRIFCLLKLGLTGDPPRRSSSVRLRQHFMCTSRSTPPMVPLDGHPRRLRSHRNARSTPQDGNQACSQWLEAPSRQSARLGLDTPRTTCCPLVINH